MSSASPAARRRLRIIGSHVAAAAKLPLRRHLEPRLVFLPAGGEQDVTATCVLLQTAEDATESPLVEGGGSAAWSDDFSGKAGQVAVAYGVGSWARVVAVGLGHRGVADERSVRGAVAAALGALHRHRVTGRVVLRVPELPALPTDAVVYHSVMSAILCDYSFDLYTTTSRPDRHHLDGLDLQLPEKAGGARKRCEQALARASVIAASQCLVRDCANARADVAHPGSVEAWARAVCTAHPSLRLRVVDHVEMEARGMGLILGVGRGAAVPPRLVILEYRGDPRSEGKLAALVGKGITYDTGGLNIKSTGSMETMYLDKHGAMTVLGAMVAVARLGLKTNVVGCLALAENSVDADSQHPHDIVQAMDGRTVHIDNTDAEGRLVLADAMVYVQEEYPDVDTIIDLATLTGACMVALGTYAAGLWSNNTALLESIQAAAGRTHDERVWHLPLFPEHTDELRHPVADVKHTGKTRLGGANTAAAFLGTFVRGERACKYPKVSLPGTRRACIRAGLQNVGNLRHANCGSPRLSLVHDIVPNVYCHPSC